MGPGKKQNPVYPILGLAYNWFPVFSDPLNGHFSVPECIIGVGLLLGVHKEKS